MDKMAILMEKVVLRFWNLDLAKGEIKLAIVA
jgi:hypothetical protein